MWAVRALVTESRPGQNRHAGVLLARRRSSASACDSHRTGDSCAQRHGAPGPPRRETFHSPTRIELQIWARWRAAGQKNESSPPLLPYPGITEKPGEVESGGGNPRCVRLGTSFRSPAITKETARSCRLPGGSNGLNTTMQRGPLTSSAVRHVIKIPARASLAMSQILSYAIPKKKTKNPTLWLSFFCAAVHRTSSRLQSVITLDCTHLVLLSKCSAGNAQTVRFCA